MKKKIITRLFLSLLAILVIMQFFQIDKTLPDSNPSDDFLTLHPAPGELGALLKNACYDCHSNHTRYPWYSNVAPISWWLNNHVEHGREELNFSEFRTYAPEKAAHKLEECFEEIEHKHMPLKSYTWTHPEARLSVSEQTALIEWFKDLYSKSH